MDIYEKYSNDEIINTREYIEMLIKEQGIPEVANLLESMRNTIWFSQEQFRDQKDEAEEEQIKQKLIEAEKILDIAKNDDEIKEDIANAIEDLEYDEEDIQSRMETVRSILATFKIIDLIKWKQAVNAIKNKIKDMNYIDFSIIYSNANTTEFFKDPQLVEASLEQINRMSSSEFANFLYTTQFESDEMHPQIIKAKEEKTKQLNSAVVNEVYNEVLIPATMQPIDNGEKEIDKIDSFLIERYGGFLNYANYQKARSKERKEIVRKIVETDRFEKYIKNFSYLNSIEFVSYMLKCRNIKELFGNEREIIKSKCQELSNEDLILLLETGYPRGSSEEWRLFREKAEDSKNINNDESIKLAAKIDKDYPEKVYIIAETARERKLISDKYKRNYPETEIENVQKRYNIYNEIGKKRYFPYNNLRFTYSVAGNDKELDLKSPEKIVIDRFQQVDMNAKEIISFYYYLEELVNMNDQKLLKEVNICNSKITSDKISSDAQKYIINYLKHRIIGMPANYACFYQMSEEGCLNDVISLKVGELQNNLMRPDKIGIEHNNFEDGR